MADEQRIGQPAGGSSGQSQVAAGFKVDSSSLQQLHKIWRQLIQDVTDFNKQLNQISDKKLAALGGGVRMPVMQGSGGSGTSYINPPTPESTTNTQTTGIRESRSALPPPAGSGQGSGASGFSFNAKNAVKTGAVVAVAGSGSYMRDHLSNIVDVDRWAQRTAQAQPGVYGGAAAKNSYINYAFGGQVGGIVDAPDFLSGQSQLEGTFGWGLGGSSWGRGVMNQAGQAGNLLGSYQAGAAAISGLGSPQAFWALQKLGIQTRAPGGKYANFQDIATQIVQKVYGTNVNAQTIGQGMASGAPLSNVLSQLGFDQDTQSYIAQLAMMRAQGGPGTNLNNGKNGRVIQSTANKNAGLGDSIYDYQRGLSFANTQMEQQYGMQARGTLEGAMSTLTEAVKGLTAVIKGPLGGIAGPVGALSGILGGGLLGGGGGGFLQFLIADVLASKFKAAGGLRGLFGQTAATAAGDAITPGVEEAAAAGGFSLSGLMGSNAAKIGIAGAGTVASQIAGNAVIGNSKKGSVRSVLGNTLKWGGTGAALGSFIGPEGTVIGGALGGIGGALYGAFGDSGANSNPWAQTGPTVDEIIAMGKPTGAVVTSTYRPGGSSYHAAHEAVDFGWPGNDPAHLLKINQFWASKYGSELAELIYTGPGGTTIKNGKIVPPEQWNSFWGSAVVQEHKNHVHVAATPQSLRMGAGGVAAAGTGGGSSSSTSANQGGSGVASSNGGMNPFATGFGSIDSASAYSTLLGGGSMSGMAGTSSASGSSTTSNTNKGTSTTANTPGPNLKGTPVQIGQALAAQRGWTGAEWDALYKLWMRESSWNPKATNPSSGAYGIPQSLPASKMASAGADWKTNPQTQEKWGMDYISGRYKDPLGAWQHETQFGWYRTGTMQTKEGLAYLHDDEMVVPAGPASAFRQYVSKRQQGNAMSPNLAAGANARGGTAPVQVYITAPIHMPSGTSPSDAKTFLTHVKTAMAEDEMFASLGSG